MRCVFRERREAQRSGRDCRARGERGDVPRGVRPSILLGGRPCEDSPGRLKCVVQVRVGPWGSYIEKPNCAVAMGTQLEWIAQFFFLSFILTKNLMYFKCFHMELYLCADLLYQRIL